MTTAVRRGALVAVLALLGACGGTGDADDAAPPPTAAGAHAYLEPGVAVRPGHVAVVRLKPVVEMPSSDADEDGVRRIRVRLDVPMRFELSVDAEAERVQRIVVRTPDGAEAARHERGQPPVSVSLPPGTHTLELHHANKGDATAPAETVFVRIAAAPPAGLPGAAGGAVATLQAGQSCVNCDLSNADLGGLRLRTGQDVSGTDFSGSNLQYAVWEGTTGRIAARRVNLSTNAASGRATNLQGAFVLIDFSGSDFTNADLSQTDLGNSVLDGANLSGTTVFGPTTAGWISNLSLVGVTVSLATRFAALSQGRQYTGTNISKTVFPPGYAGLRGLDLRYVNFSGASLAGVDLSGANLTDANLTGVSFANARLTGVQPTTLFATVKPLDVSGVDFNGFDLTQADFSQTVISSTTRFVGARLTDGAGTAIRLSGQTLPPGAAVFKGLDLSGADLTGANLRQSNLEGTVLRNAQLHGANLNYANLNGAKLIGAQLGAAPGSGEPRATLIGAYMPNVDLTDADLRSVDLTNAHVYGTALLLRTRFDSADFSGANLAGAAFSGSLTSAVFNNAALVNATFSGADLTDASFDSALLQGADFSAAARLTGVSLSNALVSTGDGAWSFTETNGMPFSYAYHATALGALASGTPSDGVVCPNGNRGPCSTPASLTPVQGGPYPPKPSCVPQPPNYDNCPPPAPS